MLDALTAAERPYQVGKQNILFLGAWTHSQDVTTDGEHYYFSSRIGLVKTTLDGETEVAMNFNAIPKALRDNYGSAHIGGISYHDGKIYAAVEDSKVWQYPIVVIYDAQTLRYTGDYHILSAELQKNGLPWLAVDAERGYIYARRGTIPRRWLSMICRPSRLLRPCRFPSPCTRFKVGNSTAGSCMSPRRMPPRRYIKSIRSPGW